MALEPRVRRLLDQMEQAQLPPITALTPQEARRQMIEQTALFRRPEPVPHEDLSVATPDGPVPIRVYLPEGRDRHGALVFMHGGGWMIGGIQTHDAYCHELARASQVCILSVDYRLAPEHPYPAGLNDGMAVLDWVAENGRRWGVRSDRLGVGGDSSGGNLAAAMALKARDRGRPALDLQVLIYPAVDYNFDTPSYLEHGEGYLLTTEAMRWFWDHYLPDPSAADEPYACPLRADDLSGLPPALILTAEYDPLRDDGQMYADRLEAAGVPVNLTCYGGVIHTFIRRLDLLQQARDALEQVAEVMEQEL